MRLNIKTKQVLGVTSTVGAVVVALSLYHLGALAKFSLEESKARGLLLSRAVYQRAQGIAPKAVDAYVGAARRRRPQVDPGVEHLLPRRDRRSDRRSVGKDRRALRCQPHRSRPAATAAGGRSARPQLASPALGDLHRPGARRRSAGAAPAQLAPFGAIRIGISTLLVRRELEGALRPAIGTVLGALIIATVVAMLLAQLFLRPIHVIKSGLSRLQRGETGVTFDLPKDEFGDLGMFFSAVSDKLSADRSALAGQKANLETVVDRLGGCGRHLQRVGRTAVCQPRHACARAAGRRSAGDSAGLA